MAFHLRGALMKPKSDAIRLTGKAGISFIMSASERSKIIPHGNEKKGIMMTPGIFVVEMMRVA
jgi:hypothetical protein